VTSIAKELARKLLRELGYNIARVDSPGGRATMDDAFRGLVQRTHAFRTVIDIGASNGSRSASLIRHFPPCSYLLVEAQPVHESALRAFCASHAYAQFVLAAAGARSGEIFFDATDPFGCLTSYARRSPADIRVPVVSIDGETKARKLAGPYLLKFDTHGFEVPILEGAVASLGDTEVIIMECYNFHIGPEALTFDEMCACLGRRGLRCIDLVCPMHRPYHGSLWQADLVFARGGRPEFWYLGYR
jgi:FkbM family methyltransferase